MRIKPPQTSTESDSLKAHWVDKKNVSRGQNSELENKDFQAYYQQRKKNLDQIKSTNNLQQSAHRQFEQLLRKDPTFPPIANLTLLKDHKPQIAIILTGKIVQHHPARVWDTLTSSERLGITINHFEAVCHYLKLDVSELHRAYELKNIYLGELQLEEYRVALANDRDFTHEWIFQKETIYPHLLVSPQNKTFNCIAESLNDQTQWIWEAIGDADKEYFELCEFDEYYRQQGYSLRSGTMDMNLPNSIILFGNNWSGIYQLNHAGRIDEHGFYRSKLGIGGTVLWPTPIADASTVYGQPLFQYVKSEQS